MASRNQERKQRWHSVLMQWHQSDQTISAFGQQRHLSKPVFCYWQRKLGFVRQTKARSLTATFVPMTLVTEPWVEIVLPTGVTLKLPRTAGASRSLLLQRLCALCQVLHPLRLPLLHVAGLLHRGGEVDQPAEGFGVRVLPCGGIAFSRCFIPS